MSLAGRFGLVLAVSLGLAVSIGHVPLTPGGGPPRRPLELPVAAACPEDAVVYYGHSFEGDAFLWCIDKSASMDWGGGFAAVKAELSAAISELEESQRFSVIAFSTGFVAFSPDLVFATVSNRALASAFVSSLVPEGSTCLSPAAVTGLEMLQLSASPSPVLFITSDGEPNCPPPAETLAEITAANTTQVPIHTFHVGADAGAAAFLAELAALNGGIAIPGGSFPAPPILRGDADGDGQVTIGDAIRILRFGFGLDCRPICRDAADVTDDGTFEPISDAITLLGALFIPGHAPVAEPSGACGDDPTPDGLTCSNPPCP